METFLHGDLICR